MRANLLKLGPDRHALLLTFHHIVTDGWSLGVLGRDLAAFYNARCAGTVPVLPGLLIQYADFAVWQRAWLHGDVLDNQLAYWRGQLAGAPASIDLPTDHPRPPVQRFRGASIQFTVKRKTREALYRAGRERNATLFMTLLAGFASLLYRYSGQSDIVIGSPIAGRNRAETEGLLGFFVNTLALRVDLQGAPRFRGSSTCQRMALAAYAHQDVPFERLVDELQPERDLSRNPLFQVMFAFQNTPDEWTRFRRIWTSPPSQSNARRRCSISSSMRGIWKTDCIAFSNTTANCSNRDRGAAREAPVNAMGSIRGQSRSRDRRSVTAGCGRNARTS